VSLSWRIHFGGRPTTTAKSVFRERRRTGSGLRWFQQHQSSQTERAIRYQDPGWKDCAARYIHTELSAATMKIFRPEDAPVLEYREDDGQDRTHIYVPIIPMVLVNSSSIAFTGFSTCIPSFDPLTSSTTPEDTHCPKNYNP
jgi:hypothetical protein